MIAKYNLDMIKFLLDKNDNTTYAELAQSFNKKFKQDKSPDAIKKAYYHYSNVSLIAPKPKILILDIETSYMMARVWGPKVEYINHTDILSDFKILTVSYKFMGDSKPIALSADIKNGVIDDKKMLEKLSEAINEADFVSGHNLASFDMKKINTRIIANNLPPVPAKKVIDTIKIARKHFGFTSNRLDFLAKFLGVDPKGKLQHEGIGLWEKVMSGDKKAMKHMLDYNIKDIVLTEKVLQKLLPYSDVKIYQTSDEQCPQCASLKVKQIGTKQLARGVTNHYSCLNCNHKFFFKPKLK
jgi:hypothetical protein